MTIQMRLVSGDDHVPVFLLSYAMVEQSELLGDQVNDSSLALCERSREREFISHPVFFKE